MASALSEVRQRFPRLICYHYMDNILLAGPELQQLETMIQFAKICLEKWGLVIALEKLERQGPQRYLGWKILEQIIQP